MNPHQKFIPEIFERDFRKCWLRELLDGVEKMLSLILIPTTMHLSRSNRALIVFLLQYICKTKALHLGV